MKLNSSIYIFFVLVLFSNYSFENSNVHDNEQISTHLPQTNLGKLKIKSPAFINIGLLNTGVHNELNISLLISSFQPFQKDHLFAIKNIGDVVATRSFESAKVDTISKNMTWPNEASSFNGTSTTTFNGVVVGEGFLVPGKRNGAVVMFNTTNPLFNEEYIISEREKGWFYHMAIWKDINRDGIKDIVTARTFVEGSFIGNGQLLAFFQPNTNDDSTNTNTTDTTTANTASTSTTSTYTSTTTTTTTAGPYSPSSLPWNNFKIVDGPDVLFRFADIDMDGIDDLIAAQFFSEKLVLYKAKDGIWNGSQPITSTIIDDSIGPVFDVKVVDMNGDGIVDLLVTNHVNNNNNDTTKPVSGVWIYSGGNINNNWIRHTLYEGFVTLKKGNNQASPGSPIPFFPNRIIKQNKKPYIALGGDGAEAAYILYPLSNTPDSWDYGIETLIITNCTVGQVAAGDVDGDGYAEVFVPAYEKGYIAAFSYK